MTAPSGTRWERFVGLGKGTEPTTMSIGETLNRILPVKPWPPRINPDDGRADLARREGERGRT
jgi:hypothetical protein